MVAYAALAVAVMLAHASGRLLGGAAGARSIGWWSVLFSACHGVIDEWHQSFVPGRACSLGDLLADCSGAVLGVLWLRLLLHADPAARRLVPWWLLASGVSVAIATLLPW